MTAMSINYVIETPNNSSIDYICGVIAIVFGGLPARGVSVYIVVATTRCARDSGGRRV